MTVRAPWRRDQTAGQRALRALREAGAEGLTGRQVKDAAGIQLVYGEDVLKGLMAKRLVERTREQRQDRAGVVRAVYVYRYVETPAVAASTSYERDEPENLAMLEAELLAVFRRS